MYDISFVAENGEVFRMAKQTKVYVKSISGLTGITASLNTIIATGNIGVNVTGGSLAAKNLTLKGFVLDGNTKAKQNLLDFFKPMRKLMMYINTHRYSSMSESYRYAEVIVKTTPTITQERHSAFTIGLYLPQPIFKDVQSESIDINPSASTVDVFIKGDVEPYYSIDMTIKSNGVQGCTLSSFNSDLLDRHWLFLDFRRLSGGSLDNGDVVRVWNENGRMLATVNGIRAMPMLWSSSTMFNLPLGERKMSLSISGNAECTLTYTPLYSGVLVDDV